MSKRFAISAALILALALPALGQTPQQPVQRAPGSAAQPAQPAQRNQPVMTNSGNVKCPASITATVNPGDGWIGGNYTATLFNLSAMDGSRTDCIYKFDYVTIAKPAPAGTKCTVAPDSKSFNCK
ncbi:MAG: hypothetical protein JSR72_03750 [Proteobacteria bacterium]|nr:hypothetical protein [Pseudomonadota bacterium]